MVDFSTRGASTDVGDVVTTPAPIVLPVMGSAGRIHLRIAAALARMSRQENARSTSR
jgi:hypothetical protein